MKKLLLLSVASLMVSACAFAQQLTLSNATVQQSRQIKASAVLESRNLPGDKGIMQVCLDQQGRKFKRIVKLNDQGIYKATFDTPSTLRLSRAASNLAESFETGQMPEDWSTYSDESCTAPQPWRVDTPLWVDGTDGEYACYSGATYSFEETYDEWLYTPAIEIGDDFLLSYLGAHDLIWMVNTLNLEDDGTFSSYEPAGVFKIWAIDQETNEKTLIHDFFQDLIGMTWNDLFDYYTGNLENYTFPLDQFSGKTIKIAFENVGANGNSVYVDKVIVDVPEASCSYTFPDWTLFWGLNRGYQGLSAEVAVMPVYQPLTWSAKSDIEGASFIWSYYDNDSESAFSTDESITETYTPDYNSIFSTNTNLFYTPELYCTADGYSMGQFSIYDYFQAGGRPDYYNSKNDTFINFLMHCSNHATEGFTNVGTGKTGIPAFGYGVLEDGYTIHDFWTKYCTGKNSASEDPNNWAKFKGVLNVYTMPETPLVIHKVVGFFMGTNVNPDAEFKIEILGVNDGNAAPTVIATAICKGSDVEATLGDSYYAADFVFDAPVVLTTDVAQYFQVKWTGFDNSGDYVAVMSNYWAPKNGINHGYALLDIMGNGNLIEDGMMPLETAIDVPGSFGMMLDAEMPWLVGPTEDVNVSDEPLTISLDSFYDGTQLTVETPEWIDAKVEGRWGNTVLTLKQIASGTATGDVKVSGPGVSYTVKATGTTGIKTISVADVSAVEVYSLQGVRINSAKVVPGIYLVRNANGTATKAIIK